MGLGGLGVRGLAFGVWGCGFELCLQVLDFGFGLWL